MATEDAILLRLIISGQSPQEIQRLAASTQGELNDRMKVYLDHLTQLHQQAAQAQTAEAIKASKAQIDAAEKQVETVAKVMRANEIAANRSSNAWKGTLEVMENIATSATFMYGILASGIGRLKELGESIDHVTNVYSALKGSIDEMRDASMGEVSDFDLITTKNRALEKDLHLTDQQFGAVAASADAFADAIGVNTKEALNQLIDGLATGRLKTLEHAGVVVNADEAYKKYAKSIGVAADQLSDHGKKIAIVQESLRAMDKKLAESGTVADDFSHRYEKMTAEMKNNTDKMLLALGEWGVKLFELFETTIPRGIRHAIAAMKDGANAINPFATSHYLADEKAFDALEDKNKGAGLAKNAADAAARLQAGTSYDYASGTRADSINSTKVASDAKAAQEERDKLEKMAREFDVMLQGKNFVPFNSPIIPGQTAALGAGPNTYNMAAQLAIAQQKMQDNVARSMEAGKETNDLSGGVDSKGALDRMEKALKDAQEKADDLKKRAGDGLLSDIIFGKDGPMGMKDKLHTFAQDAADALGMVSDAGHKMGEALGASLAAFVSGDKSKRASIRQTTHDILEALATQAYSRAIFETAEGLASLALGPIGGVSAGMHFAAAGMFAAVGTTAALGARATGVTNAPAASTSSSSSSSAVKSSTSGGGISTSTSGSGGFGSNGMRSTPANNNGQPITFNLTVMPGGEAEAGRQINKALNAYYSTTGQGVPAAMVTG